MIGFKKIKFEWDEGNKTKSWVKHNVSIEEQEEAFYDEHAMVDNDKLHSKKEKRYILLGKTKNNKLLYIAFTIRNDKIRPISARSANRKEVLIYEEAIENTTI